MDLVAIAKAYGKRMTLLAGLDSALLSSSPLSEPETHASAEAIRALGETTDLVLSSSCGLHSPTSVSNLREVYRLVDLTH